jgi:hypothetical protein
MYEKARRNVNHEAKKAVTRELKNIACIFNFCYNINQINLKRR